MPFNGNNYYRIKSVSKTGEVHYSAIVKVTTGNGRNLITLYPNPVIGSTVTLQLENMEKGNYSITLFNNQGQQVMTKGIQHNGGTASQTIDLSKMLSGVYEVKISGNNKTTTQKLIKN